MGSRQLAEDSIDIGDEEKMVGASVQDIGTKPCSNVTCDHSRKHITADEHFEENVDCVAYSKNAEAHACPKCSNSMAWSSFGEGAYTIGWVCENVRACGSRRSNVGSSRWFCKSCQVDICGNCEDQCLATNTGSNHNMVETFGKANYYDHHGRHCDKCSTKFTFT